MKITREWYFLLNISNSSALSVNTWPTEAISSWSLFSFFVCWYDTVKTDFFIFTFFLLQRNVWVFLRVHVLLFFFYFFYQESKSRTRGYKTFPCSTQLSRKFILLINILLINVKMPTIVGILTFISMINTTSERLTARTIFICQYLSFYEQLKFSAQLSWAWKKFCNLGAR